MAATAPDFTHQHSHAHRKGGKTLLLAHLFLFLFSFSLPTTVSPSMTRLFLSLGHHPHRVFLMFFSLLLLTVSPPMAPVYPFLDNSISLGMPSALYAWYHIAHPLWVLLLASLLFVEFTRSAARGGGFVLFHPLGGACRDAFAPLLLVGTWVLSGPLTHGVAVKVLPPYAWTSSERALVREGPRRAGPSPGVHTTSVLSSTEGQPSPASLPASPGETDLLNM